MVNSIFWTTNWYIYVYCIAIATQHSEDDVQKDIDNFLMANAAKLLDTNPADYFEFLEFYNKSQQGGYTQLAQ
jgi:hypothetical protein